MLWVYAVLCARHRPHWPRPTLDCRSILSYNNSKSSIHPRRSYLPSSRTPRLQRRVDFFPSAIKETAVSPEGTGFSGGSRGPLLDDSRFESIRRRSLKGKWVFVNFYTSGLLVDRCKRCGRAGNMVRSGSTRPAGIPAPAGGVLAARDGRPWPGVAYWRLRTA